MEEELIDEIDWAGNLIRVHSKKELKEKMFLHKVSVVIPKGRNGKIILARRAKDKYPFPDTLCCSVGGKCISGENWDEAVIREMKEEIGKTYSLKRITFVNYDKEDYKAIFGVFTTEDEIDLDEFDLDSNEIQYVQEFSINEIIKKINETPEEFAPTFIVILREFVKYF